MLPSSISPRDVLALANLVLCLFLGLLAGAGWALVVGAEWTRSRQSARMSAQTHLRFVRFAALGAALAMCAWLLALASTPFPSVAARGSHPRLLGAGLLLGLSVAGTGGCAILLSLGRLSPRLLRSACAGLGSLALIAWGAIGSYQMEPELWRASWLEMRSLPVTWFMLTTLHGSMAWTLSAWVLRRNCGSFWAATALPAAVIGAALITFAPIWLPPDLGLDLELATREGDPTHPLLSVRLGVAAVACWLAAGAASLLAASDRSRKARGAGVRLSVGLAVVACAAAWLAQEQLMRPWALRGICYANGVTSSQARVSRRAPFLAGSGTAHLSPQSVGPALAAMQCAYCHPRTGSRSLLSLADRKGACAVTGVVYSLRDADQWGHPYRLVMPPLLGSDEEIRALVGWVVGPAARECESSSAPNAPR